MVRPKRGEVWVVDLGYTAKRRPCLVMSIVLQDEDRVIVTVVPRTTQITQSRHEIAVGDAMFQKPGVFSAQMMLSIPCGKFEYKIGDLTTEQMTAVETVVSNWLGLTPPVA
jgi:mRNA interferase MazF